LLNLLQKFFYLCILQIIAKVTLEMLLPNLNQHPLKKVNWFNYKRLWTACEFRCF